MFSKKPIKPTGKLPGHGIRVASFFSGGGGLDIGFEEAGFETVFATDIEKICCETLKANRGIFFDPGMQVVQADIRKLRREQIPANIDLVVGGPPCQTFSASGRRAGGAPGRLDERGTLFEAYCRVISELKPKAFLFENVRGILGTNKGRDWEMIVKSFEKIGYTISYRILDALDYGVAQQRERTILVGHSLTTPFLFPMPTFGPDSASGTPHLTAGAALAGLVDNENKEPLYLIDGKYAHLLPLVPPGQNYLFFTAKRGYPKPIFAYRSRFSDFLYKANPDAPVKTLIARPGKYTGPFHWENRCFTVTEYMRLQGFPDGYVIRGSRDEMIRQVGNSVCPRFARHLALVVAKQIFNRPAEIQLLPEDFVLSYDRRKSEKAQHTRARHEVVLKTTPSKKQFKPANYTAVVQPHDCRLMPANLAVSNAGKITQLEVHADDSGRPFAEMRIEVSNSHLALFAEMNEPDAVLEVKAYGESEQTIQTMWNAVDNWVIKSSNFHSLVELYGHFTEPHPVFEITNFTAHSSHPIAAFAKHCSNFDNCSRYFRREHLTKLFGVAFRTPTFLDLVKKLRAHRFDIRCHETNVAIPQDSYMVCYPFILPARKQMNFSLLTTLDNPRLVKNSEAQLAVA